jgi:hypothetical protein
MFPCGKRFVRPILFVLGAMLATPAPAQAPSEAFLRRVDELVHWIAANSSYPAQLTHVPNFAFLSPETIRHTFSGSSLGYSSQTSSVRAAQVRGTIYLPDTFALGRDDYILVHELVHHLQDESGKPFDCLATREREAYSLQSRFVDESGVGEKPNDMFMLLLRCDIR